MSGDVLPEATDKFEDVPAEAWYAKEVAWAISAGVVKGISSTVFAPEDNISRQDMAVMLVRYAAYRGYELPILSAAIDFVDAQRIADYAREAVSKMHRAGIIGGRGDNLFAPEDSATRAESCRMIAALLKAMEQ